MKRVMVVSGSAGHGHVMAGRAVEAALRARHPHIEVVHVDAVKKMWSLYEHVYRKGYVSLVDKHPNLWRKLYDITNRKTSAVTHAITVAAGASFVRMCRKWRPDAIVCTHFLAPEILSRALRKGKVATQLHAVVTDHDTHRVWYYPEVLRYYVASDLVAARLALTYGVQEERIHVTGIPVKAAFSRQVDPLPIRLTYGLDPTRPTVLFLSGGFAAGPMRKSIVGLWKERRDIQVIAVCGRNERLRRRIARCRATCRRRRCTPLGFTDDRARAHGRGRRRRGQERRHHHVGVHGGRQADDHLRLDSRPGGAQRRRRGRSGRGCAGPHSGGDPVARDPLAREPAAAPRNRSARTGLWPSERRQSRGGSGCGSHRRRRSGARPPLSRGGLTPA